MARPMRFVYPRAGYHDMARGDGGKAIPVAGEWASDPFQFLSNGHVLH